jgi:hypothetical protein
MLGATPATAAPVTATPLATNTFRISGDVLGVFSISTAEDCVASNLGVSTGTGARVIGFDLTDKAFLPAYKWIMQIYVPKAGTTHFGSGPSGFKVELGAYTAKDKTAYAWLQGPGTVTISSNFKKGRLDVTLPPEALGSGSAKIYISKANKNETVVGNWECG